MKKIRKNSYLFKERRLQMQAQRHTFESLTLRNQYFIMFALQKVLENFPSEIYDTGRCAPYQRMKECCSITDYFLDLKNEKIVPYPTDEEVEKDLELSPPNEREL